MIQNKKTGYLVSCDNCPNAQEYDLVKWNELTTEMRADCWLSVKKDNGKWYHYCPTCHEWGVENF